MTEVRNMIPMSPLLWKLSIIMHCFLPSVLCPSLLRSHGELRQAIISLKRLMQWLVHVKSHLQGWWMGEKRQSPMLPGQHSSHLSSHYTVVRWGARLGHPLDQEILIFLASFFFNSFNKPNPSKDVPQTPASHGIGQQLEYDHVIAEEWCDSMTVC